QQHRFLCVKREKPRWRPGPYLAGALTACAWCLRLRLQIKRHGVADEVLQSRCINLVVFVEIDGAADISFEAGVEEAGMVRKRSPFGEGQLDGVFVRLSRAEDAAVRPDGDSRRCRLGPLPLFDNLRVGLMDEGA